MDAMREIWRFLARLRANRFSLPPRRKLLPTEVQRDEIRRIVFCCQHEILPEILLSLKIFRGTRIAFPNAKIIVILDQRLVGVSEDVNQYGQ